MVHTPHSFLPRDIAADPNRFYGSYVQVNGSPRLEILQEVAHPAWEGERPRDDSYDPPWSDTNVRVRTIDFTGRESEYFAPHLNMTPKWCHKGYTMYNYGGEDRLGWISLCGQRQYRWGLSARAFEMRKCWGFPTGRPWRDADSGGMVSWVFEHGASYVNPARLETYPQGVALTPSLALHALAPGAKALVHNCRQVIGWWTPEHGLQAELAARPLTAAIQEYISYGSSEKLASFYADTVLPRTFQPRPLERTRRDDVFIRWDDVLRD